MEAAKAAADDAYAKINTGSTLDQVAADDSLDLKQTDEFTLGGSIPGVGREPAFAAGAFKLKVGEYSEPIEGTRGYYIIQLLKKSEFDETAFQNQKESLKTQLSVRQRNQIFALWYNKLKEESNIKDYRSDYL